MTYQLALLRHGASLLSRSASVRKWGGVVADYQPIHDWFDASKMIIADFRHRELAIMRKAFSWLKPSSLEASMHFPGGFEPPHGGIKIRCLTAWRRPNGALFQAAAHGRRTMMRGGASRNRCWREKPR